MKTYVFLAVAVLSATASGFAIASDISSSNWSESANANTATPPHGFPENQATHTLNDSAREVMAAVKRWYDRINATRTSGGSANAQTLTYTVAPDAYRTGDVYTFIAGFTNTGATTLNINGKGAKSIKLGARNLVGGEIVVGRAVTIAYDGTNFQLISSSLPQPPDCVGTNAALQYTAASGWTCAVIAAVGGDILLNNVGDLLLNGSGDILLN